ncbi:HNH endonuclease signature motif containing protein [Georgenia yuyongxinii]|uniref:HNH endonuclease n=1 Tax=Georgenia yuyongxinii TaxID=2589797 RepID=A0A552WPM9_9MICO|nr:HNH endonuclease signature motif containing protein [Georgenia yuyongxinii]TRW44453.1 HNH endonuclease [Georgenia yuyongxinii]TRW44772.1 HNH endonuclease [Georgenia yuyongxinii]
MFEDDEVPEQAGPDDPGPPTMPRADEAADRERCSAAEEATPPKPDSALAPLLDTAQDLVGAHLIATLDPADPLGQDVTDLVELVAQWSRAISFTYARRSEAIAALVTQFTDDLGTGTATLAATTELAMRLGVTRQAMKKLVDTSLALTGPLMTTGEALEHGALDPRKAEMVAAALEHLPYPVCEAVQDAVLPTAPNRTHPQFAQDLSRALIEADHHDVDARHKAARSRRRVCHPRHLPDGMASMYAVFTAPDALALDLALDGAARSAKATGDSRTVEQLRADILAAVGAGALAQGGFGTPAVEPTPVPRPAPPPVAPRQPPVPRERRQLMFLDPEPDPFGGGPADPADTCPNDHGTVETGDEVRRDGTPAVEPPAADISGSTSAMTAAPVDAADRAAAPPDRSAAPPEPPPTPDPPPPPRPPDPPPPPTPPDPLPPPPPPPAPPELEARRWFPVGEVGGVPVRINVTVPITTLLGGDEPGTLHGYGPIDPATARALALGGTWRRLVTDPVSGTVLDIGRARYRPPADLAALVRARDRTCFRPGCGADADGCELDHTEAFARGGSTAYANLGPGCAIDHRLKTLGDFQVRQVTPGVFDWTSRRTGRTYRREADGRTTPMHPRTGEPLTSGWVPDYDDPPPF